MLSPKNNKFAFVDLAAIVFLLFLIILVIIPKGFVIVNNFQKQKFLKKCNSLVTEVLNSNSKKMVYTFHNKKETSKIKLNYRYFTPQSGKIIINNQGQVALALYSGKYCANKDFFDKEIKISFSSDCTLPYFDDSDAHPPLLEEGMIPIILKDNKWVKANINEKWYDYNQKEWANVVLVSELVRKYYQEAKPLTVIDEFDILAYFVWIPRYKYKLFNVDSLPIKEQEIEVVFESTTDKKELGSTNGSFLTHPAFSFGEEELEGFWVGKFETTGRRSKPTIKPNMSSLVHQNIGSQFEIAQAFNDYKIYGLNVKAEAHMMKNMEWGAVAYLSHSKYGKNKNVWANPSQDLITGCAGSKSASSLQENCPYDYLTSLGQEASTTGNVYGIYDMSGGTAEYVMGGLFNKEETEIKLSLATFDNINNPSLNKFVDKYKFGLTSNNQEAYQRRLLGDATGETRGWYQDTSDFIKSETIQSDYGYFWFLRGGYYNDKEKAGLFSFSNQDGGATSYNGFRVVIPGKNKRD